MTDPTPIRPGVRIDIRGSDLHKHIEAAARPRSGNSSPPTPADLRPARHLTVRQPVLDRLIDFFNTPFGFGFYLGVCVGSVGTVGAAFVWGLFL